jgi:LacI family transcriptional regulator
MLKRSTIKDVARAAGVSLVTVSRVANDPARVQAETRERVLQAMRSLGYSPNVAARSMRTNLTRSIGFLTPELTSSTNAAVAQGAEQALSEAGYTMLVTSSNYRSERECAALDLLRTRRVDGIILYVSDEEDRAVVRAIEASEVPIVLLDRTLPVSADLVLSDHVSAMAEAVRYLAGLGHRRLALVQRDLRIRPVLERRRAFAQAATAAGLPPVRIVQLPLRPLASVTLSRDLFVGADAPTALIVEGALLLRAVLQGLRSYALRVPKDRSVIGIDTMEVATLTTPETTSIVRNFEVIGRSAAELMLRRLAERDLAPQSVVVESQILLKGSCAAPPPVTRGQT